MRRFFTTLFVFSSGFLFAQLQVLLKESFSDNTLGWYEGEDSKQTIRVIDGFYEMITPEGFGITYIHPPIDEKKNFSFEAQFSQTAGNEDSAFGFVWGYDEATKFNNFIISTNGHVNIMSTSGAWSNVSDWKKIDFVKPQGQFNHLKLVQQNGSLKFYVNGTEVNSIQALPWHGSGVGFFSTANTHLLIDNFEIHTDLNINLPENLPRGLVKENLGPSVNTIYDEVTPKISVDGKTIYFTRKKNPQNIGGLNDDADIWYSTSSDGVTWSESKNLNGPVNSVDINNLVSVSQDNNMLLVADYNDFEVFERTATGWESKGNLGVHFENESLYFEATQSADGNTILFAARNKDNLYYSTRKNERDIFVSLKSKDGSWCPPFNLGSVINTAANEMSPFLAADGVTLYFASEGHAGYGGSDIFMSKRLDDTWLNWSIPVNLGPEINTFGYDAYYTLPASGDIAYMCTSDGSYGRFDLVRISLAPVLMPDPVALITGKVLHAKTKMPIGAEIIFENMNHGEEAGEAHSNPETGEYSIALPYGVNYGLLAQAKGFLSVNENLDLVNISEYIELKKDLYLLPIEVGTAIQLNNVFFEQGRPILKQESFLELDRLVKVMIENPEMKIELSGHSDNVGNHNSLVVLSQQRVAAVKEYLVKNGIQANRITGKGYGPNRPLVKNDTEEHRKMNRRVEFKIVKK